MQLSAPDLPDFRQVAVNVAPEHLQFIVCKVWINFFHGIEEFRNLHVLIQILRLFPAKNRLPKQTHTHTQTETEAKTGSVLKNHSGVVIHVVFFWHL